MSDISSEITWTLRPGHDTVVIFLPVYAANKRSTDRSVDCSRCLESEKIRFTFFITEERFLPVPRV